MATFAVNVLLTDPVTGSYAAFEAGSEIPEWGFDQITNPAVVEGGELPAPADKGKPAKS